MTNAGPETPAAAPDPPSRPTRRGAWRVGTPLVGLVIGGLFVVSAGTSQGTDLRPGRYPDLASLVQAESDRYDRLQADVDDLGAEVEQLTDDVDDSRVRRYRRQVAELEDPAGLVPRTGTGLSITLSDAPEEVLDAALQAGADEDALNRLVVHQQDIQAVVNALWVGGASAVTIEGQRVVTTTGIKCEGNAVQLQGVPYPEPYTIQAVGEQTDLIAALLLDERVTGFREDAENPAIDVGWELLPEDVVEAPAYAGLLDISYARPLR